MCGFELELNYYQPSFPSISLLFQKNFYLFHGKVEDFLDDSN